MAEPLHSVGKNRDRIVHGEALHRPAGVTNHYLVEGKPLFGSAYKEMSPYLWNCHHDSGLASNPFVVRAVIHDSHGVSDGSLKELQAAFEQNAQIPDLVVGIHGDLCLAVVILSIGVKLVQKSTAESEREVFSIVLVPLHQLSDRIFGPRFTGFKRIVECRVLSIRCWRVLTECERVRTQE